jgi:hypothetical protein
LAKRVIIHDQDAHVKRSVSHPLVAVAWLLGCQWAADRRAAARAYTAWSYPLRRLAAVPAGLDERSWGRI